MVKVTGSSGKTVKVNIIGISELIQNLQRKTKQLITQKDVALIRAANLIQQEVQESIIGNRAEPRSVKTGKFANSIIVKKVSDTILNITPDNRKYPGTNTTTGEVALHMEYGTSKGILPRRHFRNSLARNKKKMAQEFENELKQVL